jgi:hypothetical protein
MRAVPGISESQAALLSHSLEFRSIALSYIVTQEAIYSTTAERENPLICHLGATYALTAIV